MKPAGDLPRVDVIVLSWNRTDDTVAAIRSALAQAGVDLRVLVADQGSRPEHIEALRAAFGAEPRVHLELLGRNLGVPGGRNAAAGLGTAPIIVGLDNDAEFRDSGTLARIVPRFEAEPLLAAVAMRIIDVPSGVEHWDYPATRRTDPLPEEFPVSRFLGGAFALRRSAFERAGGFDADLFFLCEEQDLAYRLINAGHTMKWVRDAVVYHRADTEQKVAWSGQRYYFDVRNRIYVRFKFGEPAGKQVLAAGAALVRGIANGVGFAALRGFAAGIGMVLRLVRSGQARRDRLSPAAWRYILAAEERESVSLAHRIRRQFQPLQRL